MKTKMGKTKGWFVGGQINGFLLSLVSGGSHDSHSFTLTVAVLYFIGLAISRLGFYCDGVSVIQQIGFWILFYLLFKVSISHDFEGTAGAIILVPELNFKPVCTLYCFFFFFGPFLLFCTTTLHYSYKEGVIISF